MVTMKTIAAAVNVSQATVSYVLNGRQQDKGSRVNPETALKVEAMAAELGYRRNEIARSVRTGKTNVLGFIGVMGSSYAMDIISGIAKTSAASNYLLKLFQLDNETDIGMIAKQCIEQRLSGVICRSLKDSELDTLHRELQGFDVPIVLVDNSFSHDWCSRVVSDDFVGAQLAVEHLLKLGHRKIANITNSLDKGFEIIRNAGYRQALTDVGIEPDDNLLCILPKYYEFIDAFDAKLEKFLIEQQPTALFCNSDPIAMNAIHAVNAIGLKVPEDISIIGYADLNYTAYSTPRLTTVKQPFIDMGKKVTEIILNEVTNKVEKIEEKLKVELVVRESTAPASS